MRKSIYSRAIDAWGVDAQLAMFAEEAAEASAAAIRFLHRGRGDACSLADEVADMEIMCAQMRVVLGDDLVENGKNRKLQRLADRIAALDKEGD